MPIYEYQCEACGAHHETIQKMSDAPLKKCPACGKPRLKRLISAPVFRLKGGGWYETDFKSDAESKRNLHAEEKGEKAEKADSPDKAATAKDADGSAKAETKADAAPKPDSTSNAPAKADRTPASKPAKQPKPAARRAARRPRSGPRRGR